MKYSKKKSSVTRRKNRKKNIRPKTHVRGRPILPAEELRGAKLARLSLKMTVTKLGQVFGISKQAVSKDIMKYREAVVREG